MNIFSSWSSRSRGNKRAMPAQESEFKSAPMPLLAFQNISEAHWSEKNYVGLAQSGFMKNPIVYRCVRLVSETAAALPWSIYDGVDELANHPLIDLLGKPNQRQSGQDFAEALYGHLLLAGNAYIRQVLIDGVPRELHLLRPDLVEVTSGPNGWPTAFKYTVNGAISIYPIEADGSSEIIHICLFNPIDDMAGHAPIRAAHRALDIHNKSSDWNKALLDNSARPSGALVYNSQTSQNLNDEQFARLKQELEDGYSGAHRAGRPMLLEGGLDWKAMGYSPKDMDFIEGRNAAARDIALAFGVPPMLLAIPGDNTYSNYKEANRAFWHHTILPMVNRLSAILTNNVAASFGDNILVSANLDATDAMRDDRASKWERLQAADFLTVNEKREALGFSPLAEFE